MSLMDDNFATKSDFREFQLVNKGELREVQIELRNEMQEMKSELRKEIRDVEKLIDKQTIKLGSMMFTLISISTAILSITLSR